MPVRSARTTTDEATKDRPPTIPLREIEPAAFLAFRSLRFAAAESVAHRLGIQTEKGCAPIDRFPWDCCREELLALLEYLEPCVEFGLLQPITDYLDWSTWRSSQCAATPERLALVLLALGEFFRQEMESPHGTRVADLLGAVHAVFVGSRRHLDVPPPPGPGWPETQDFTSALVEGRQEHALLIMNRFLEAGRGLVEFELNVIQPAMVDVGRRWQQDALSVAVEHGASVIARTVMAAGLARSTPSPQNGRSMLLACIEGNDHDLGLHMVADACRLSGWQVQCLGANVPTQDLVRLAGRMRPDVLGLSIAFAHQLRRVRSVAFGLRESAGQGMPIILAGGVAAVRHERLARNLGADAVATDSMDALALASRLVDQTGT